MESHVRAVGIIDIILGALKVLAGLAIVVAGISAGIAADSAVLGVVGGLGGLLVLGIGVLAIITGIYLPMYRNWARILQIIYSIVLLPGFPIGTAFGIYALWVVLSSRGAALFQQRPEMRRAA